MYRGLPTNRTRSITGKVTAEEHAQIKAYVAEHNTDVSALTRQAVLEKVAGRRPDSSDVMLEVYKRSMAMLLRLGDKFTEAEFLRLCRDAETDVKNGHAQT
jgi:hypothetical protein